MGLVRTNWETAKSRFGSLVRIHSRGGVFKIYKEGLMKHIFEEHTDCQVEGCLICDGGLAICTVCGLAEGSLTTDCCGYRCAAEMGDSVYNGKKDFVNGQWVDKKSPHAPHSMEWKARRLHV